MMRPQTPRLARLFAVLGGAVMLAWPAFYNRYPLLFPDSISYIGEGRPLAHAVFLHRVAGFAGMRSELYSLGIFPFHWNVSPWGIVALHALLTATMLRWVLRSVVLRDPVRTFLVVVAGVSVLTSASWYVSLIMPDILGALLYLGIYLLIFAPQTLALWEHAAIVAIAWWGMTAHATHLLLSAGLVVLLLLLVLVRWPPMQDRLRSVGEVALIVIAAAGAQIALHGYLYGKPTLNGNRVPYMMARVIADGPGRLYLENNCGHLDWAICEHVGDLPTNDDEFLWADGGIWPSASPATQARLLQEEMPLVRGTLRAYPGLQTKASLRNFAEQLNDFGVDDFDNNTWMEGALDETMAGSHAAYARSLQVRDEVPSRSFSLLQRWVVMASSLCVLALIWPAWRRHDAPLLGLTAIVTFVVFANAFVTAVLSTIDSRYQSRVIWLVPLLAAFFVMRALDRRRLSRVAQHA